jgi:hypothetical protein
LFGRPRDVLNFLLFAARRAVAGNRLIETMRRAGGMGAGGISPGGMGPDVTAPTLGAKWDPARLAAVEAEFFALRRRPADLPAAFLAAVEVATGGDTPPLLRAAGVTLANAVMSHPNDLAYHSPHHFAETVLAFGWMCDIARTLGRIDAHEAAWSRWSATTSSMTALPPMAAGWRRWRPRNRSRCWPDRGCHSPTPISCAT